MLREKAPLGTAGALTVARETLEAIGAVFFFFYVAVTYLAQSSCPRPRSGRRPDLRGPMRVSLWVRSITGFSLGDVIPAAARRLVAVPTRRTPIRGGAGCAMRSIPPMPMRQGSRRPGRTRRLPRGADLPGATLGRLASAFSRLGDREKAVSLLRLAQRAHPDDFWTNFDLAATVRDLGQSDEAIRFFSVAVAVRPGRDLALDLLGNALYEADRLEDAAATLHRVITLQQMRTPA